MKKKLVIAALAAAMVMGLTACGSNNSTPVTEVSSGSMELKEVSSTGLDGLCQYLEGNGAIAGNPIEMKADIIGAKEGKKFAFKFSDVTTLVEVYEFDLDNLNDTGRATLESVKNNGNFVVLDQTIPAHLSESGKYIYTNSNTKTEEPHITQNEKLDRLFREYDAQESKGAIKPKKDKEVKKDQNESSKTESETSSK